MKKRAEYFLDRIIPDVRETINSGYYNVAAREPLYSLKEVVEKGALIAEVKPRSPSKGVLISEDAVHVARELASAGADALSILTEPKHFKGRIDLLREDYGVPLLMKDFIIDERQISGGDAILLILSLLDLVGKTPNALIECAHEKGIEVLLETHTQEEFRRAMETDADLIGINNRDLRTLRVDINTTIKILEKEKPDRPVVSESGIETAEDVERVLRAGASAVLVGTSILTSKNMKERLGELKSRVVEWRSGRKP
ncbi:MAG: indole-3-glycerol-phosphate synthase [Candidatus Micrarchaeia archaeon]